jgi:endonuclease IV
MEKTIGVLLLVGGLLFATSRGAFHVYVHYQYINEVGSHWEMADRASTIAQKSEYIDRFVDALEDCDLYGMNDALFYPNAVNSFDENMKALKSLQNRLNEIKGMDESSFEYQTALQQITSQEQGEAIGMLHVLSGCWAKANYYTSWNIFISICFLLTQLMMVLFGLAFVIED